MNKLFLFDVDGTLISTGGAGLRALSVSFHELYGVADVASTIDPAGKTDPAIFRELHQLHLKRHMTPEDLSKAAAAYLKHLEIELQKNYRSHPLAGVKDFLEHLTANTDIVMGLGTGNLETGARLKLEPAGLNSFFSFGGFGSDAEERSEVLIAGHHRAMKLTGKQFRETDVYIIGDTPLDIAAARKAGFKVAAVATGRTSYEALKSHAPDYVLNDLSEGQEFLQKIYG